jgi:hypothetical protein
MQGVIMELTNDQDRAWLNNVQPKTKAGSQHEARLKRFLATHGSASVPPNMKAVFRHLFA